MPERPTTRPAVLALLLVALLCVGVWLLLGPSTDVAPPATAPPVAAAPAADRPASPSPRPRATGPEGCSMVVTVTGTHASVPVLLTRVENHETLGMWRARTEAGQARFDGLEPGAYRATATDDAFVPASMEALTCTGTEVLQAALELRPADVWFLGQVTDAEGNLLDAEVSIVEAGRTGVFPGPASVDTDDGTYRLGAKAGTAYNLYAMAEGYHFGSSGSHSPSAGDEVVVDFELKLEGLVRGTVRGPDGEPLVGATVQRHPMTTKKATTDEEGRYALASMPGRRHILSAHRGDLYGWVEAGVVQEGEDRFDVDIPMERGRTVRLPRDDAP